MRCTVQREREQNKLNRLTYGINFWQGHTRYPTSALSYVQTCEGFPGSGISGVVVSGGRPGKNAVMRCCIVFVRCFGRVRLAVSGGRPGVLSNCLVDFGGAVVAV